MQTDAALGRRGLAPLALLRQASDQALVEQARAGSDHAFEALVSRHRRSLLTYCERILGSSEEAEDAVQLTFMAAYSALMRAEQPRAWRPWLYGIARHRCLSALRGRGKRAFATLPESLLDRAGAELAARDELRAVLADIAILPDDQRVALVLAEFADLSHREIAEVLGCRRERVKALAFQARTALAAHRAARETPCAEIREALATLRGAALRRSALRRHLSGCPACTAFAEEMRSQRRLARVLVPASPMVGLERGILGTLFDAGGSAGASAIISGVLGASGLVAVALTTVAIHDGSHRAAPSPPLPRDGAAHVVRAASAGAADYGAMLAIAFRDRARPMHDGPQRRGQSSGTSAPAAEAPTAAARPSTTEPGAATPHASSAASPSGDPDEARVPSAAHADLSEPGGSASAVAAPGAAAQRTPAAAKGHDEPGGANGPPGSPPGQAGRDRPQPKAHAPVTKAEPARPHSKTAPSGSKPDEGAGGQATTPPSQPTPEGPSPRGARTPPPERSPSPTSPKPDPQHAAPEPSGPPGQSGSPSQAPGGPPRPGH